MADVFVVTADPATKKIQQNLLPAYLQPDVIGRSVANTVTVSQTVNGVIPNRPSSSTALYVIWRCWDDPGAKALDNDVWVQVAPTSVPAGQALYPSPTLYPAANQFPSG